MRAAVMALWLLVCSTGWAETAQLNRPQRRNGRIAAGVTILAVGVGSVIAGQLLLAEAVSWGIGNGLGEHYDPEPAWVGTYKTAGLGTLVGGLPVILVGVTLLVSGGDGPPAPVSVSVAPTRGGGVLGVTMRF